MDHLTRFYFFPGHGYKPGSWPGYKKCADIFIINPPCNFDLSEFKDNISNAHESEIHSQRHKRKGHWDGLLRRRSLTGVLAIEYDHDQEDQHEVLEVVDAIQEEVPEAHEAPLEVSICKYLVGVYLLIGDQLE